MLRRLIAPVSALALGGLAVAGAVPASAAAQTFTAHLTGSQEPSGGDPTATGTARVTVDSATGRICYVLTVSGLDHPTAAHIHEAPPGVAGPVVAPLQTPVNGRSAGCTTVAKSEARDIVLHPEDHYVNVHNAMFPAGAIRGQL
ncbi:MAG: CHRD domain-containing protein [Actinomycetota bacterium]|nr:CHRD domain-containing protein [Actinomycetota bacterium]